MIFHFHLYMLTATFSLFNPHWADVNVNCYCMFCNFSLKCAFRIMKLTNVDVVFRKALPLCEYLLCPLIFYSYGFASAFIQSLLGRPIYPSFLTHCLECLFWQNPHSLSNIPVLLLDASEEYETLWNTDVKMYYWCKMACSCSVVELSHLDMPALGTETWNRRKEWQSRSLKMKKN